LVSMVTPLCDAISASAVAQRKLYETILPSFG